MNKIKEIIHKDMFPLNYNSNNPDEFYYEKYLFLLSAKLGTKYRLYPEYINNESDYKY